MTIDVTDANFESTVLNRSTERPIIIDLWAPWCGPCRTLGPIIEKVVEDTDGAVELVKVNVDENPQVAAAFQVQSIPAVYAIRDRKVVDGFIGALGEPAVREFVGRLVVTPSEADLLVEAGDEASLRQALELDPDHHDGILKLTELLIEKSEYDEALALLQRIPETAETRVLSARARLEQSGEGDLVGGDDELLRARLDALLDRVRDDEQARREYIDVLETLSPEDPNREAFRKALATRLF